MATDLVAPPPAARAGVVTRTTRRPSLTPGAAAAAFLAIVALGLVALLFVHRARRPVLLTDVVAALDPANALLKKAVHVGRLPTSIAGDATGVWVLNSGDRTITRIDRRGAIVGTFSTPGVPTELAAGFGALWVESTAQAPAGLAGAPRTTLSRLDPRTGAVTATADLPGKGGTVSQSTEHHIAPGNGSVWTVNPDLSVSRVDPATSRVVSTVHDLGALAVTAGPLGVWVLGQRGLLTRMTADGAIAQQVHVRASGLTDLAEGGGAIWATDPGAGTVWRIVPSSAPVERAITVARGAASVTFGRRSVWVANLREGTVTRINPRTTELGETVLVGDTPRRIVAGAAGVWVSVAASAAAQAAATSPRARHSRSG